MVISRLSHVYLCWRRPPGWCTHAKSFFSPFYFPILFPHPRANLLRVIQKVSPHSTPQRSPHSSADVRRSMSCTVRASVDRLSTVEYFSAFKAVLDIFGLCLCDKKKIKKTFLTQHKQIMPRLMWMLWITKALCERVCIWVHIWASFCLLAVSENGQGLFLSGLIRRSCLFTSLITLPRANIPFVFPPFSLIVRLFCCCCWTAKKFSIRLSLLSFVFSSIFYLIFFSCPMTGCWQALDRPLYEHTHKPAVRFDSFFQVLRYVLRMLMGPMTRPKTQAKNKLIWNISKMKSKWFWQQWHFSFASKPGEVVTFPIEVKGLPVAASERSLFIWFVFRFCFTSWWFRIFKILE